MVTINQCKMQQSISQPVVGINQSPGSLFHRPGVWKFNNNQSMQNATINQLTSVGHKSIPSEHLPQAWRLKSGKVTINQGNAKCKNRSVNQWWA
jgi:hypothetical protein